MARFLKHTYVFPAYWASALINGDFSGLEDDEADSVEACLDWLASLHGNANVVTCSEESWFSWTNDWDDDVGGDVLEYTLLTNAEDYYVDHLENTSHGTLFVVYLRVPYGEPIRVAALSHMPGFDRTAAECLEYWLARQEEA